MLTLIGIVVTVVVVAAGAVTAWLVVEAARARYAATATRERVAADLRKTECCCGHDLAQHRNRSHCRVRTCVCTVYIPNPTGREI